MSKHLFTVFDRSPSFWESFFLKVQSFKQNPQKYINIAENKRLGFLFFEPSSRTRWSFEKAALDIGARAMVSVVDQSTSLAKGEENQDTLELFLNLNFDAVVVRSKAEKELLSVYSRYKDLNIINAGFGAESHPTQALLDYFTLSEALGFGAKFKLLIMGDLLHSRVVRSHLRLAQLMGYQVGLLAFESCELPDQELEGLRASRVFKLRSEALNWADAVMSLRVQKERLQEGVKIEASPLLNSELKSSQFVMHPGPFMRNEDLEDTLIHSPKSLIYKQKENGSFVRAVLLASALEVEFGR